MILQILHAALWINVVIWVCSRRELSIMTCHWGTSLGPLEGRILPCDQLDKVIVEGDASTSIKDRGATIPVEVSGHNLHTHKDYNMLKTSPKPLHPQPWQFDVHTWSSVYPRMPFMGPSAAALTTFLISSYLACSQQSRHENLKLRLFNQNHFYHEGL